VTESSDWPYLQQVLQLERRRVMRLTGEIQTETVYGVTSLTAREASPQRLLELNREYWGIENGLHYRRDVTLREDAGRTKFQALRSGDRQSEQLDYWADDWARLDKFGSEPV